MSQLFAIRWPKYWSFSPSNEHPGLISFRIEWLDLLAVQGTHKSQRKKEADSEVQQLQPNSMGYYPCLFPGNSSLVPLSLGLSS